jgi:hypothetical protein
MKNFEFTNLVKNLELVRPFGPTIAKVKMPQNLIDKLNIYVDKIIGDDETVHSLNFGQELAGNVKQELIIDKKFEYQKYFYKFLNEVVSAYILRVTNQKISKFNIINSWIVRQFEDEYNPVHIHTGHLSRCWLSKSSKKLG